MKTSERHHLKENEFATTVATVSETVAIASEDPRCLAPWRPARRRPAGRRLLVLAATAAREGVGAPRGGPRRGHRAGRRRCRPSTSRRPRPGRELHDRSGPRRSRVEEVPGSGRRLSVDASPVSRPATRRPACSRTWARSSEAEQAYSEVVRARRQRPLRPDGPPRRRVAASFAPGSSIRRSRRCRSCRSGPTRTCRSTAS